MRVELVDPDPAWPALYDDLCARIAAGLGATMLSIAHVGSTSAPDHLRANADDRRRYESVKRRLAARDWPTVQDYADAKSDVVTGILARARQSRT